MIKAVLQNIAQTFSLLLWMLGVYFGMCIILLKLIGGVEKGI